MSDDTAAVTEAAVATHAAATPGRRERVSAFVRRPRISMLALWLLQFGIVVGFIFFYGASTAHGLVTMDLSPKRMIAIFGFADAGSYLQAAENLIANSRSTEEWAWVLNLWPPGMVWLDAAIIRFSPLGFGLTFGLVVSLVWSLTLSVLTWPFVRSLRWIAVVLVVELALLGSSPFQSWMFDEGLFYADAIAAGLFVLGLGLIVNRVRAAANVQAWIRDGVFAGIAFASAVYFRASYNLVPWALFGVAVVIGVVLLVRIRRKRDLGDLAKQGLMLAAAGLSILILMQPYTAFVQEDRGRTQFVQTEDLVFEHAWENSATKDIPQWMIDGGSTIGCDLDRPQCLEFEDENDAGDPPTPDELRDSLVGAILAKPLEFAGNRVNAVTRQWFGDELDSYSHVDTDYRTDAVTYSSSPNTNPAQNILFLALLIASFVSAIVLAVRGRWALLLVPILALALLAPFAIVHVEVRYLIPLKLIGLFTPVLLLMLRDSTRRRRASTPE